MEAKHGERVGVLASGAGAHDANDTFPQKQVTPRTRPRSAAVMAVSVRARYVIATCSA